MARPYVHQRDGVVYPLSDEFRLSQVCVIKYLKQLETIPDIRAYINFISFIYSLHAYPRLLIA